MSFEGLIPGNPFDEKLRSEVAPQDYVNPRPQNKYDLIVIGAGPGGLVAAAGAAALGAQVALIEKGLMGGDCLNVGCVPSKGLLAAAHRVHMAKDSEAMGIRGASGTVVDFPAMMDRMRRLRAGLAHHDSVERFTGLGIDVFLGAGSFASPETVRVGDATLRFRKALISTGARAAVPEIPGLKEAGFHTNETLFTLTSLPPRFLVIGGGPIGSEMAQAFRRFGSQVTMIIRDHLLPKDEPAAADLLRQVFQREGIELLEHTQIISVRREGDVRIVRVKTPQGERDCPGEALLLAAGRALNIDGLNLEAAGIELEKGKLKLTPQLRTSNPRVFAAGDIAGGPQFTHAADAHARLVLRNAFFFGRGKASDLLIPWCTYTDPEVAHVGLTQAMAEQEGIATEVFCFAFSDLDRGVLEGAEGFVQATVRKGTDRALGFTIVGPHAGDFIGEAALLLKTTGRLSTLDGLIHPYPTLGEAFKRLGGMAMKAKFTPTVAKVFKAWFKFMR